MISLRYGTIPVVRETGGLKDTIIDIDRHPEKGNGFSFSEYTPKAFIDALARAVNVYRDNPGLWLDMIKRGWRDRFLMEEFGKGIFVMFTTGL